jgi:hypothetical protein
METLLVLKKTVEATAVIPTSPPENAVLNAVTVFMKMNTFGKAQRGFLVERMEHVQSVHARFVILPFFRFNFNIILS